MGRHSIIDEAHRHLAAWQKIPFPPEIVAAELWEENLRQIAPVAAEESPEAMVARITSLAPISCGIPNDSPGFTQRTVDTLRWLERQGMPFSSFPSYVQDTPFGWPKAVGHVEDRRYSMAFLYHLCIAAQIKSTVGPVETVFELGSGYGGLARVLKLLNPQARFVLCDLPQTLYFCFVFLRRHFPNARFQVIERAGEFKDRDASADFTFVPAPLARDIAGSRFDLAVNTSSLSEMTQSAVDWYLDLIQNEMKVSYLYHLNRFATPEQIGNACATSYVLDRDWEVLHWAWKTEGSFNLVTYPETPPLLNLIARRVPEVIRSDALYDGMVASLRRKLASLQPAKPALFGRKAQPSEEWFRTMWELIRIERNPADIRAYLDVIGPLQWREVPYYDGLLQLASAEARAA